MLRSTLAVIAGYFAMAISIMVILILAWAALGPQFAFQPGTLEATGIWMILNVLVSLAGAILGGFLTARIDSRTDRRATKILAVFVVVLGLAMAVGQTMTPPPETSPLEEARQEGRTLSTMEAMSHARQPTWYAFLLPFLGATGVIVGGRLWRAPASDA